MRIPLVAVAVMTVAVACDGGAAKSRPVAIASSDHTYGADAGAPSPGASASAAPTASSVSTSDARPSFDGSHPSPLGHVDVQSCKMPGGPTGAGHATVIFVGSGEPTSVALDGPPFAGTPVGECVIAKFRALRVPPFDGGAVKLGKSFTIH